MFLFVLIQPQCNNIIRQFPRPSEAPFDGNKVVLVRREDPGFTASVR